MSTLFPYVANAIMLAGWHPAVLGSAAAGHPAAGPLAAGRLAGGFAAARTSAAGGAVSGLLLVALLVVFAFVAAVAGIVRRMAAIFTELLQVAATLGTAFLTLIVVAGVAIVLLLRG